MCFFGSSPKQQPITVPTPSPAPTYSDPSSQNTAGDKRRKLAALRYGMLSTMKTGGRGVTGKGADLISPAASGQNKTLGA